MSEETSWHLSPDNVARKCSAKKSCLYSIDGVTPPHYETAEEAYASILGTSVIGTVLSVPATQPITNVVHDPDLIASLNSFELQTLNDRKNELVSIMKMPVRSDEFASLGVLKKDVKEELSAVRARISTLKDVSSKRALEIYPETQEAPLILPDSFSLVGEHPSGSLPWLLQRKNTVGGSDVGAILAVDEKWGKSNYSRIVKSKVEPPVVDEAGRQQQSDAARRGDEWEGALVEISSELLGEKVYTNKATFTDGWRHVNVDGFTVNEDGNPSAVVECKTSNDPEAWKDGSAPAGYILQVQHYMDCLNVSEGWIIANVDDSDLKMVHVTEQTKVQGSQNTRELYPELPESFTYQEVKGVLRKFIEDTRSTD